MQGSGRNVTTTTTTTQAPGEALPPIPPGGGRFTLNSDGEQKTVTYTELPPEIWRVVRGAENTAITLMALIAAIFILGPFARMIARRMERRHQAAPTNDALALRHQIETLQQSVDTMSIEIERISESQRFQSKLLFEKKDEPVRSHIS